MRGRRLAFTYGTLSTVSSASPTAFKICSIGPTSYIFILLSVDLSLLPVVLFLIESSLGAAIAKSLDMYYTTRLWHVILICCNLLKSALTLFKNASETMRLNVSISQCFMEASTLKNVVHRWAYLFLASCLPSWNIIHIHFFYTILSNQLYLYYLYRETPTRQEIKLYFCVVVIKSSARSSVFGNKKRYWSSPFCAHVVALLLFHVLERHSMNPRATRGVISNERISPSTPRSQSFRGKCIFRGHTTNVQCRDELHLQSSGNTQI